MALRQLHLTPERYLEIERGNDFKSEHVDGVLINPTVIFEVLSPSTEYIDRGVKLSSYRKIDSLVHYVLVSQNEPRVEVYTRSGDLWSHDIVEALDATISLSALGVDLSLSDIYRDYLDFPSN